MVLVEIRFKREESSDYEKGFLIEAEKLDNNSIIDKKGAIVEGPIWSYEYGLTTIDLGKLLRD